MGNQNRKDQRGTGRAGTPQAPLLSTAAAPLADPTVGPPAPADGPAPLADGTPQLEAASEAGETVERDAEGTERLDGAQPSLDEVLSAPPASLELSTEVATQPLAESSPAATTEAGEPRAEVEDEPPSSRQSAPELPRSQRPKTLPAPPPIGTRLVCENFTELGDGVTVAGEVRDFNEDTGEVMLWIAALRRRWPIFTWVIRNGKWEHFAGDYPPPGREPRFDARFRVPVASVDAPPRAIPAPKKFEPPRQARPGHVWVELASTGLVNAIGFTLDGTRKVRDWAQGDKGEIEERAVADAPSLFKRL